MEQKIIPQVMIIGFLIMSFCMLSCNENSAEKYGLRFELAVLNSDLEEVTAFDEGDPIVLQILVINDSGEDLLFAGFDPEEVFRVYRVSGSGREDMGRPYANVRCAYSSGLPLDSGDTSVIRAPWIPKIDEPQDVHGFLCNLNYENPILRPGIYETTLHATFNFSTLSDEFEIITPKQTSVFTIND